MLYSRIPISSTQIITVLTKGPVCKRPQVRLRAEIISLSTVLGKPMFLAHGDMQDSSRMAKRFSGTFQP